MKNQDNDSTNIVNNKYHFKVILRNGYIYTCLWYSNTDF